jgi:hypothetical protein
MRGGGAYEAAQVRPHPWWFVLCTPFTLLESVNLCADYGRDSRYTTQYRL